MIVRLLISSLSRGTVGSRRGVDLPQFIDTPLLDVRNPDFGTFDVEHQVARRGAVVPMLGESDLEGFHPVPCLDPKGVVGVVWSIDRYEHFPSCRRSNHVAAGTLAKGPEPVKDGRKKSHAHWPVRQDERCRLR